MHNLSAQISSKLDRIQFKALRGALEYRRSTPLNVIVAEAKEIPLFLRNQLLCINYLSRAAQYEHHPVLPILDEITELIQSPTNNKNKIGNNLLFDSFRLLENIHRFFPTELVPLCYSSSYEALSFSPEVNLQDGSELIDSRDVKQDFLRIFNSYLKTFTCLFTDRSIRDEVPFAGFAITLKNAQIYKSYRTASFVSSYCVESMAILESLKFVNENNWLEATIFSDSLSVLTAIDSRYNPRLSLYLILKIKDLLYNMYKDGKKVFLVWIPGHKGIPGNEKADMLAKDAIYDGIDTQLSIAIREIKNYWKKMFHDEFLK